MENFLISEATWYSTPGQVAIVNQQISLIYLLFCPFSSDIFLNKTYASTNLAYPGFYLL